MNYLNGLTVLILGLGDSGLAMARWCARCGANVRVADTRQAPPQAAQLAQDVPAATLHHGLDASLLDGVNLVLKSPGLAPNDANVQPLLARADELGLPVRGELSLFASALADLKAERGYAPKVLAITGTNGKTTTTSLTAQLAERAGKRVGLAGNIGPTLLDTLAAALDAEPVREPTGEFEPEAEPVEEADVEVDVPHVPDNTDVQPGTEGGSQWVNEGEGDELADDLVDDYGDVAPTLPAPIEDVPLAPTGDVADEAESPLVLAPPAPREPVFEVLPEVWVLELSSFQLDGVTNFEPSAATVLNITQDHLDWHGSMQAYGEAKARIFGKDGVLVINRDDDRVEALVPPPQVIKAAVKGRPSKTVHRKVVRFGLDAPQAPGDFGLVHEGGLAWLVRAMESDPAIKRKRGEAEDELIIQRLMPADALRIRGRHNASNALAALALATAIGLPLAPMLHGLREYRGEPHRVEHVATVGSVDAYDDSKGTNVGATVAALNGLGADIAPSKLVIILGGDGKGQDFAPLAAPVARFVRAVALIGRDAPALDEALRAEVEAAGLPMQRHDTLEAATRWAYEQARAGDAVLLSPACASLDMFRNYAHRAQVFIDTVHAIAADRGEMLA
ncbi:UDP-N-acetylmuramoyl-L-alanine--D-glutamate ligase [Aquabacterium sp.]|uniref:UDP-N-acetylmuramoyl-L-alanine--D-glutamate ligase n=1 Tax=Aquabacterium sp. TaxID=1872578 RepID=UPI0035B0BFD1